MKKLIKTIIYYIDRLVGKKFIAFHHFPFDYLKVTLSDISIPYMEMTKKIMENSKCKYRLTDGLALGLYREGGFIKHDDDLDFDIIDTYDYKSLVKTYTSYKFHIGRIVFYEGKIQQLVFYNNEKVVIDFNFWYRNNEFVLNYAEEGFIRKQSSLFFDQLTFSTFKGQIYPLPGNIEEWLCMRYGNDWRIPKKSKGDWKEECGDMESLQLLSK